MATKDLLDSTIPNAKDRQKLKALLAEMTQCMQRIDDEREAMKDIAKAGEEQFSVKTKLIRKLATTMYKHNYADLQAENEHFELLYESLVEGKKVEEAA